MLTGAAPPHALFGVALVAGIVHRLARPVPDVGIAVPILVPPIVAAGAACCWRQAPRPRWRTSPARSGR
ncbi:MAG: DUF1614 domain-containing protein [Candidatus Binatia bacterium]